MSSSLWFQYKKCCHTYGNGKFSKSVSGKLMLAICSIGHWYLQGINGFA